MSESIRTKKEEENELKEIVKEEYLSAIEPIELRNPEVEEQYREIIESYSDEIKRIEYEKKIYLFLPVLKQKFVYLYCSGQYKHKDIADMLGIHPTTIANWLKQDEIRTAIKAYQEEENIVVDSSLKAIRMRAVDKLSKLLNARSELVALQAAKEILDRTGHMAVQKQEINVNMTFEEKLKSYIVDNVDFNVINDDE